MILSLRPIAKNRQLSRRLISAGIFSFALSWNEWIDAPAFIQSSEKKSVPVAS